MFWDFIDWLFSGPQVFIVAIPWCLLAGVGIVTIYERIFE